LINGLRIAVTGGRDYAAAVCNDLSVSDEEIRRANEHGV